MSQVQRPPFDYSSQNAGHLIRFDELFAETNPIVIGRERDCSIHLPHPTVSLYHAILERTANDILIVQDLASATGVFLNGRRIRKGRSVRDGDRFGIGPFLFTRRGHALQVQDSSRSLRLEARSLGREIRLPGGGRRKLLDDINLVVRPGEFVSLLGPSGSGKSTLMDCLNGRRRATHGKVLANGQDFYEEFDSFRQSLGYVPQKDIVHTQLSVHRALYYTARLRLPTDTDNVELEGRIEEVIKQMELGPHRDTMVGNLSGGQIKRVSLGAELLARPSLLYIDEATSGLDAGTEARMMQLFRHLSDEGKSIICITHTVENVDQCDLIIVLAAGKLVYYGPPEEATAYFEVKHLGKIYDQLQSREIGDWAAQFRGSRYYKEFVEDRLAESDAFAATARQAAEQTPETPTMADMTMILDSTGLPARPIRLGPTNGDVTAAAPETESSPTRSLSRRFQEFQQRSRKARRTVRSVKLAWHQFRVQTNRYVELIMRDPRSLRLLLLQAPIVAVFLLVGFVHKPYQDEMPVARQLNDSEKKVLAQLSAWNLVLADERALSQEQKDHLKDLQFTVKTPVGNQLKTGKELHDLIQPLHQPGGPAGEQISQIESYEVTLENATPRATVSGKDLLALMNKAGKSNLAQLLLTSKKPVVLESNMVDPRFTYVLLNILCITIFWFGCNNAAKEIVKEEAIYARERAVNLGILPYLGSKFLILSIMSAFQTLVLTGVVFSVLALLQRYYGHEYPPAQYMLAFAPQFGMLALLSIVGVAVGLLISACVTNPDRANALLPYVLIPQIILGGAIIPIRGEPISTLSALISPVCWGFRGVHRGSHLLPTYHPFHLTTDYTIFGVCTALTAQMVIMLVLTALFLRMKDVRKK
jgi:ABC-type multidrug transport system ATPase subunit